MIAVSIVSLLFIFCDVAEGGFVRTSGNSNNKRASAHLDKLFADQREDVSVASDPITLVRSYSMGQHRDVVHEHYRGNFSLAPTHLTYDPKKLSDVSAGEVNTSFEYPPLSFAELFHAVKDKKSEEMGAKDEVEDETWRVGSKEETMTEEEAMGWASKACFYVGDPASRQGKSEGEANEYPDLADVCNPDIVGASNAKRCCVCPHMVKAVRPGMNGMFTGQSSAREKCSEMGKGWLHEGGLCMKSGTMIKAITSLGLGKGCIDR